MKTQTYGSGQETPSWIGDLWGGLAAMLVALPSSIALGVLTYTVILMAAAARITRKVPAAIVGLLGGNVAYFVVGIFSLALLTIQSNPLIIGPTHASGSFLGAVAGRVTSLFSINFASIQPIIIPALTLSVLLSIDTLKTCVGLDTLTRSRPVLSSSLHLRFWIR